MNDTTAHPAGPQKARWIANLPNMAHADILSLYVGQSIANVRTYGSHDEELGYLRNEILKRMTHPHV